MAVVSLTTAQPELGRAIESVKKQGYPCKHYIFVNGEQYYRPASEIIQKFDNLTVIYSPMDIQNLNELIAMLVKEDFVFYLSDKDFFAPTYIESQIKKAQ
ncbi:MULTISPECIES: glycosyltransferase [Mannheimia]|uniref:glycosyltransferase n=1 Tax=Mannheimia indoligenes TaxID=3103145 RepID=UPI002FE5F1F8